MGNAFRTLREKCNTKYLSECDITSSSPTPIDLQYYNLDTRADYYHALRILSGMNQPDSSQSLIAYLKDTNDLFLHTAPIISFVGKPGTMITPLVMRLIPLLECRDLKVVYLIRENDTVLFKNVHFEPTPDNLAASLAGADFILTENFGSSAPNKIEILQKGWSLTPVFDEKDLLAVFSDFPYRSDCSVPVLDSNRVKNLADFLFDSLRKL